MGTLDLISSAVELSGDRLIDAATCPLALVAGVVVKLVVGFDPQPGACDFEHILIVCGRTASPGQFVCDPGFGATAERLLQQPRGSVKNNGAGAQPRSHGSTGLGTWERMPAGLRARRRPFGPDRSPPPLGDFPLRAPQCRSFVQGAVRAALGSRRPWRAVLGRYPACAGSDPSHWLWR